MPLVDNNGIKIYYETHGEGSPLLFIHGPGGQHAAWWQQVTGLRDRFKVLTMDLRGFGRSESHGDIFDSLDHPGDITAVLEDAGLENTVLVGQAIGASAGLKVALRRPDLVRGIILAHSLGGIDNPELNELARKDQIEAEKLTVLDRLMSKRFQAEEPDKAFLFRQMGTLNVVKMADLRNVTAAGPTVEDITRAGLQVAFLTAENDAVLTQATIRRAHALVPGSLLEVVPDAAHAMYWENPELFNAAVVKLAAAFAENHSDEPDASNARMPGVAAL